MVVNQFVTSLTDVIAEVCRYFEKNSKIPQEAPSMERTQTPYGARLSYKLPHGNSLCVHLKDKEMIRHRKCLSQVMYLYYLLGWKIYHKIHTVKKDEQEEWVERKKRNTYVLALDGDTDFYPSALSMLVDRLTRDSTVGAAYGRIHPTGVGAQTAVVCVVVQGVCVVQDVCVWCRMCVCGAGCVCVVQDVCVWCRMCVCGAGCVCVVQDACVVQDVCSAGCLCGAGCVWCRMCVVQDACVVQDVCSAGCLCGAGCVWCRMCVVQDACVVQDVCSAGCLCGAGCVWCRMCVVQDACVVQDVCSAGCVCGVGCARVWCRVVVQWLVHCTMNLATQVRFSLKVNTSDDYLNPYSGSPRSTQPQIITWYDV
ncbi:uncharacterized protein LOC142923056 isoform X1 [Petromyzon marinus]|uniref:uncharacterized protein LOC142923056 isoform X1 n=1 Tax=Petromyzon marinus TaxID=7757 RepID=UPI003F71B1AF